jgi:hypothetical protein
LPGDPVSPFGLIWWIAAEAHPIGEPRYSTRLMPSALGDGDLYLEVGGRMALEFRRP